MSDIPYIPEVHRELAACLKLDIAYDGGIKIKDGTWTPPMSYQEAYEMLMRIAEGEDVEYRDRLDPPALPPVDTIQ